MVKPHVEWRRFSALLPYAETVAAMERAVEAIGREELAEQVWLLEHPPLYTAGTSARVEDLLEPDRFPVFDAGRGGQYTYHGPGQRVVYVMLDLNRHGRDVRAFVTGLEQWLIATLACFGIEGNVRSGRVGVWVARPEKGPQAEDKIAAIGIRLRRWVSFHGLALNVAPALEHFAGIVPCGISTYGVTSFDDLGIKVDMNEVDTALLAEFESRFQTRLIAGPGELPF